MAFQRKADVDRGVPHVLIVRRLGICHRCTQRPAGCWKAVPYGCFQEYREAARRAAEAGACPLGKLK